MKRKKPKEEKFNIDLGDDFNEALRRLLRVEPKKKPLLSKSTKKRMGDEHGSK